jgi:hypothetical protein
MPCYRCGTRQVDPEQGKASPWTRGVLREHQVLVCPDCAADALPDLDRCVRCGSAHLIRRLDQVECLDCGLAKEAGAEPPPPPSSSAVAEALASSPGSSPGSESSPGSTLSDEVARALDRVLRRG